MLKVFKCIKYIPWGAVALVPLRWTVPCASPSPPPCHLHVASPLPGYLHVACKHYNHLYSGCCFIVVLLLLKCSSLALSLFLSLPLILITEVLVPPTGSTSSSSLKALVVHIFPSSRPTSISEALRPLSFSEVQRECTPTSIVEASTPFSFNENAHPPLLFKRLAFSRISVSYAGWWSCSLVRLAGCAVWDCIAGRDRWDGMHAHLYCWSLNALGLQWECTPASTVETSSLFQDFCQLSRICSAILHNQFVSLHQHIIIVSQFIMKHSTSSSYYAK